MRPACLIGDSAHKHAATNALGNIYGYDANRNQTTRTIAGTTYIFVFDYENRLTEVKQGSTSLAVFLYDANGNRVRGTVSGTTTVYIAGIYERQGAAYTSYYEGGGLRRSGYTSNNGVFYMMCGCRWFAAGYAQSLLELPAESGATRAELMATCLLRGCMHSMAGCRRDAVASLSCRETMWATTA